MKTLVQFSFQINSSFLNYPRARPITIPVHFNELVQDHGLDAHTVRIHGPDGNQFGGRIYGSQNNQCEYHQIIVKGSSSDALSQLNFGEKIVVRITKGGNLVEVHLSRSVTGRRSI